MVRKKKYDGERNYFSKIMKSWEAVVRRVLSPAAVSVPRQALHSSHSAAARGWCGLGVRRWDPAPLPSASCEALDGPTTPPGRTYLSGRHGTTTTHWIAEVRLWGAEVLPATAACVLGFLALLLTSCQGGQNRWLQIVSKFGWCVA